MTLPSVWRAAGVKSGFGIEPLMDGVMLHELMHSRQFYFATPMLAHIAQRNGLGDDAGDDSVQERYKSDPVYVAAYRAERDLLFAAAAAPSDVEARRLAGEALVKLRERRARWFTGADAYWADYDDIFLAMEGIGQWLAYTYYTSPAGLNLPRDTTLAEVRRGGRFWTQDQGLALFLVVDRLVPDWQRQAFASHPVLAEGLLERAATAP
jgi:hypothetical protein